MKNIIKLEELGMFLPSLLMFLHSGFAWWWFLVLLLAPDISMTGYGISNRHGALFYNLFYHKNAAVLVFGIGYLAGEQYLKLMGAILFGYASMDRIFGYGLKFTDSFNHAHWDKSAKNDYSVLYFSFSNLIIYRPNNLG